MTFYTQAISNITANTFQILLESNEPIECLYSIVYTISLYTLVPISPFIMLFRQDSLDFIVCLSFFSKSYKQTKEKLLTIEKNIVLQTLRSITNSEILLGFLVFSVFAVNFTFFENYNIKENGLLVYSFLILKFIIFSIFIMLLFNSYISMFQYVFIFMKRTLEHNNQELYSLINRERNTLFVVIVH
ncbi:hypothetical protein NBO_6g0016 [Nosema bombycis CQ1]|uniref:Uncharacterized protein n=1 Tax=Nosema bombycis (strain CQ1 / CVCC 102059) TaxID=578461 RepID=R0MBC6_NOSB1|nr:hypothetical protein NBO_6g0016 [Nosema bombycis CQ1]|eukprot:EOB15264.1 hypothetical protein NBO_6g0016 [Nosema bombycis CQ1]